MGYFWGNLVICVGTNIVGCIENHYESFEGHFGFNFFITFGII